MKPPRPQIASGAVLCSCEILLKTWGVVLDSSAGGATNRVGSRVYEDRLNGCVGEGMANEVALAA